MISHYLRSQLWFLARVFGLGLVILSVSRILLSIWQFERLNGLSDLGLIMVNGLRIDVSLLLQLLVIPLALLLIVTVTHSPGRWTGRFNHFYSWLVILLILFMELATPTFIMEYDTRPDRLFIEYLSSPNEVSGMLFSGYLLTVLFIFSLLGLTGWLLRSWLHAIPQKRSRFSVVGLTMLLTMMLLSVIGIRSGLQHRPINPSMVAFSQDRMVNTLPLNSLYQVLYAVYQLKNEASASQMYGSMPEQEMLTLIQAQIAQAEAFTYPDIPTLHKPTVAKINTGKDLIIVVEESLGAQFVGALGGKPVTRYIDQWADKSWWFERLYATGTRSARGLEAMITGFLPSPARSVLKLPKAQTKFFSIAELLANQGYDTGFIYGGESHFDNMRGFFLGNGFQTIIDQNDYTEYDFMGNWGVSDEDLFNYAYRYLSAPTGRPKLTVIFTSSNHTPYQFPAGKIDLFDNEVQTVNNAVRYADYALGQFLQRLEDQGRLDTSVVMVVADHDARVLGADLVPIEHFHIPGFIIGAGVPQLIDKRLVSQIDLAPTLMSLMGIDQPHPMVGYDLTQKPTNFAGRAIMQYGKNQAYMTESTITVLRPEQSHVSFSNNQDRIGTQLNTLDIHVPLAHALFASWAYDQQRYRLPLKQTDSKALVDVNY